jgi:hypothetical protein
MLAAGLSEAATPSTLINEELLSEKLASGAFDGSSCVSARVGSFHPTAVTEVGKMWARLFS